MEKNFGLVETALLNSSRAFLKISRFGSSNLSKKNLISTYEN